MYSNLIHVYVSTYTTRSLDSVDNFFGNEKMWTLELICWCKFIVWAHLHFFDKNIYVGKRLYIVWAHHRFFRWKYIRGQKVMWYKGKFLSWIFANVLVYGHISCVDKYFKYFSMWYIWQKLPHFYTYLWRHKTYTYGYTRLIHTTTQDL